MQDFLEDLYWKFLILFTISFFEQLQSNTSFRQDLHLCWCPIWITTLLRFFFGQYGHFPQLLTHESLEYFVISNSIFSSSLLSFSSSEKNILFDRKVDVGTNIFFLVNFSFNFSFSYFNCVFLVSNDAFNWSNLKSAVLLSL